MWQTLVSIIKMTPWFLWDHEVTATPCHKKIVHRKDQFHMETLLQMPKAYPSDSSDPRESHLWVHPHKVKKGTIQPKRFKQKLYNPQAHHNKVQTLTVWFVSTHSQKVFSDIRCQEVSDDGIAETAEEHTFAQSNTQETGKSHPCPVLSRRQNLHWQK